MRGDEIVDRKEVSTISAPGFYFVRLCLLVEFTLKATFRPGQPFLYDINPQTLGGAPTVCEIHCPFKDHERLVEPDGIEPTTSCLQSTRSTN